MNIFTLLLILYLSCTNQAIDVSLINEDLNNEWQSFKINYNRKYDPLTEISRRLIWEANLKYINQHNLEYYLGQHTYYLGINEFTDMTHEEFKSKYLGYRQMKNNFTNILFIPPKNLGSLPPSIDWRTKGYVTPVKNQGQCGSCWSFSTTGSLEGQHFKKTGKLISLSEQQLVDCSGEFGNGGCNGGWMDWAFKYIQKYGIESESSYPYTAQSDQCIYDASQVVAHCRGFVDIKSGSESQLAKAVATKGPISVAIDASHRSFQSYKSGVYNQINCSKTELDHAVLVVGYGSDNGVNYWLVKNSWGVPWGLEGYIKMSKDRGNQCGIVTKASFPLV